MSLSVLTMWFNLLYWSFRRSRIQPPKSSSRFQQDDYLHENQFWGPWCCAIYRSFLPHQWLCSVSCCTFNLKGTKHCRVRRKRLNEFWMSLKQFTFYVRNFSWTQLYKIWQFNCCTLLKNSSPNLNQTLLPPYRYRFPEIQTFLKYRFIPPCISIKHKKLIIYKIWQFIFAHLLQSSSPKPESNFTRKVNPRQIPIFMSTKLS